MVRSFRDSGEAKESKQQGTKESRAAQRERGRQAGRELREALDRGKRNVKGTEYTGALADAMRTANINQFNERQLRQRALQDAPPRKGFGETIRGLGRGIMDTLTPGRMIASGIGSALFGPVGGILAGLLANQRTVDAAKKDFRDTIDFFRPRQKEQPMMTNMPMRRPDQMFPIRSVTETTGMPFMDQIPDMFPDNQGQPTYTPEAAGFGLDSLMQDTQDVTIPTNITDDMMFRAAVGDPYVDTNFGALTFGPTVFGPEGFRALQEQGLVPVGVSQNITPGFLRDR